MNSLGFAGRELGLHKISHNYKIAITICLIYKFIIFSFHCENSRYHWIAIMERVRLCVLGT